MEKISDSGKMLSVEITEVNPLYDNANQTAQMAVEFILSALGKKIMWAGRRFQQAPHEEP